MNLYFNKILSKLSPLILSDELYIRLKWLVTMDYPLNLKNPLSFNEKLNWLKLHDRRPSYISMVDKIAAKEYVASLIGASYIIPTLKIWDNVSDIQYDLLPERFVLKTNHDSGGVVVCSNKFLFDKEKASKILHKSLRRNFFYQGREWPYKMIEKKVFAEEYMEDSLTGEIRDYKFFCFDGEVKALFIATDRSKPGVETKFDFYDENFNHLDIINGHPNANTPPAKPRCFEEMKSVASVLSQGLPFIRVDLYEINGKVYFGELTFCHWGGFTPFVPRSWDYTFGEWISLPDNVE